MMTEVRRGASRQTPKTVSGATPKAANKTASKSASGATTSAAVKPPAPDAPDASLVGAEDFVPVSDGKAIFYGGDQAWFSRPAYRSSACGVVAAANLIAYLERDRAGRNIYTREQYLSLLQETSRFVKPWCLPFNISFALGVWPSGRFVRGVLRFGKSRNIALAVNRFREPARSVWTEKGRRERVAAAAHFISEALARDCPAAILIGAAKQLKGIRVELPGGGGWNQKSFALHWAVATAIRRTGPGEYQIRVSTWGGSAWLPLDGCLDTCILKSRVFSFSLTGKEE